ncbi:uncharacterized protein LOC121052861 [Rosa chinensis]|uniref:uncharacterized protein LOC121052861 n=1 Tax=Rosa chinensis TaxID=74649 RepID=UPI001AD8E73C|nr:uncharacterized protein LOC121052861 [Rosa chinensis]
MIRMKPGKLKPMVLVRDPLRNWELKWVTTVENPEKPGQILWVKYMEALSEDDLDIPPLSEKMKEMKKTASRILSTRGTKTDQWVCGICNQWDDHWPPTCPYTDDPTLTHFTTAQLIQAQGSNAEEPKYNAADCLAQASKKSGNVYSHWQCRICGKIDDHWPPMCPYKCIYPDFAEYSDSASATGKSTFQMPESFTKGGDVMFCGICGARDHIPKTCYFKRCVKLFTGTPPPVKTIDVRPSSPERKFTWSTDFLVVPEEFLHTSMYQWVKPSGDVDEEFFASPAEMVEYIMEANKKSKPTGSMAEKPVVVGGAFTSPRRPLEYCRICCKYIDHCDITCSYLEYVPPGATVGPGCLVVCSVCGSEKCDECRAQRVAPLYCLICGTKFDHLERDCPLKTWY